METNESNALANQVANYARNPTYGLIPERIVVSLLWYANGHCPTGSFLRAVLENDLVEAVGRADEECCLALPAIVKFVYSELPGTCWHSPAKVKAWLNE
jgi:hypothetical protein